jgi:hypothetical protein
MLYRIAYFLLYILPKVGKQIANLQSLGLKPQIRKFSMINPQIANPQNFLGVSPLVPMGSQLSQNSPKNGLLYKLES